MLTEPARLELGDLNLEEEKTSDELERMRKTRAWTMRNKPTFTASTLKLSKAMIKIN